MEKQKINIGLSGKCPFFEWDIFLFSQIFIYKNANCVR